MYCLAFFTTGLGGSGQADVSISTQLKDIHNSSETEKESKMYKVLQQSPTMTQLDKSRIYEFLTENPYPFLLSYFIKNRDIQDEVILEKHTNDVLAKVNAALKDAPPLNYNFNEEQAKKALEALLDKFHHEEALSLIPLCPSFLGIETYIGRLSKALANQGDPDHALLILEDHGDQPWNAEITLSIARSLSRQERTAEALALKDKHRLVGKDLTELRPQMIQALLSVGKKEQAHQLYLEIIKDLDTSPQKALDTHKPLGLAHGLKKSQKMGDFCALEQSTSFSDLSGLKRTLEPKSEKPIKMEAAHIHNNALYAEIGMAAAILLQEYLKHNLWQEAAAFALEIPIEADTQKKIPTKFLTKKPKMLIELKWELITKLVELNHHELAQSIHDRSSVLDQRELSPILDPSSRSPKAQKTSNETESNKKPDEKPKVSFK